MASGWWESDYANLEAVSPADFTVNASPSAPRNWGKISSVVASGGFYMGGTPCVTLDNVVYYAGDDYTQGTDGPPLMRWDGQISATVVEIPDVGATPAKAILSLATDGSQYIYISTWDSGTTSADFAGRVFRFNVNTGAFIQFGSDVFTLGHLPYALTYYDSKLWVGTNRQDPAASGMLWNINSVGTSTHDNQWGSVRLAAPTGVAVARATAIHTYKVTEVPIATGVEGAASVGYSTTAMDPVLSADTYVTISWTANYGLISRYNFYRTQTMAPTGLITFADSVDHFDDIGFSGDGTTAPSSGAAPTATLTVSVGADPTPATSTYVITALDAYGESLGSTPASCASKAVLSATRYNRITWNAVTGATSYNVYRTAGHTSQGLLFNTAALTFDDAGYAATSTQPLTSSGISASITSMCAYGDDLFLGVARPAATFASVYKRTATTRIIALSNTVAPGGAAGAYNAITAMVSFEGNLYAGYWNDDATDITLIRKWDGAAWSTVKTLTAANAAPLLFFHEHNGKVYVYGGGDAKNGIFYDSLSGTAWTDQTALLPTAREAVPFMGTVRVLGS